MNPFRFRRQTEQLANGMLRIHMPDNLWFKAICWVVWRVGSPKMKTRVIIWGLKS